MTPPKTSPEHCIQLIRASDADLPFARDLTRNNMASYHQEAGLNWDDERFEHYWERTLNTLVVIKDIGRRHIAGLVRLHLGNNSAALWDLQLLPHFQSQGIGSQLMERILDICRKRNVESISLQVYKTNPAMRLYQRFGFSVDQQTPHMVKMSRRLP